VASLALYRCLLKKKKIHKYWKKKVNVKHFENRVTRFYPVISYPDLKRRNSVQAGCGLC